MKPESHLGLCRRRHVNFAILSPFLSNVNVIKETRSVESVLADIFRLGMHLRSNLLVAEFKSAFVQIRFLNVSAVFIQGQMKEVISESSGWVPFTHRFSSFVIRNVR